MRRISSVQEYFDTLTERFIPEAATGVHATVQYELSGDGGGTYHVIVNQSNMQVVAGRCENPDTTEQMSAENFVKLANGDVNGAKLLMQRQHKTIGNIMLSLKMKKIFPSSTP